MDLIKGLSVHRAKTQAIMQYAGARNSGVPVGACNTTLSADGDYWSLELGQAVCKWPVAGDNQLAVVLQGESQREKYYDLICLSLVYCLASPVAQPKWKLVNVDHPGHRVERVESL